MFGVDIVTLFDYAPNQIMLPLGGLLIAVFVGWFVRPATAREELALASPLLFRAWHGLLRYLVPVAVFLILAFGILGR